MFRRLILAFALLLALPLRAEPVDPALQKQLLEVYDRYNKAIAAGKADEAMALRSAPVRKQMQAEFKDRKNRAELMAFAKEMIPDGLEVRHSRLGKGGQKAMLLTVASKKMPDGVKPIPGAPAPGSVARGELTLDFVKEGSAWKFDNQTFGMDPDKIAACTNTAFEPIEAYDQDANFSMGGPIMRVAFNADHTLVVVRVTDSETCTFLPDRAFLESKGFNPNRLVPYAIVEIEGLPHKTDKQKVWIENLSVRPEED